MATDKPVKFKIPKALAAVADRLYQVREERLSLQKQVDYMAAEEAALRDHLINNLPKSQATGIAGKLIRASIESRTVVVVKDWDAVYSYILKNGKKNPGVFSLLQRRVGDATVKEMWENGKEVPGVEALKVPFVSLTKL